MNIDKKEGISFDELEQRMTPEMKLMEYLYPPEVKNGKRFITEQDIDYMIAWVGLRPHMPPEERRLALQQLGLWTALGTINKERADLISGYIWDKHPAKPNFPALLKWLETNHPRKEAIFSTPTASPPPKNKDHTKARKKKKQARKKAQKRNRKK